MIWKKIKNFENYEVSNTGVVRNTRSGTIVSHCCGNSRKRATLYNNKRTKTFAVDKLVADAFIPGDHDGCDIIHINGDVRDDNVRNLSLVNTPKKRIRVVEYDRCYNSRKECCAIVNVPPGVLSRCLSGKQESYKGLHFEEVD